MSGIFVDMPRLDPGALAQLSPQIKAGLPLFSLPKLARYKGNPIMIKGAPGAWDQKGDGHPCVIWDAVASRWKVWFYG